MYSKIILVNIQQSIQKKKEKNERYMRYKFTKEFNRNKSSFLRMKRERNKSGDYEITCYKKGQELIVVVDEYEYNKLLELDRTISIDDNGYPYLTLEDDFKGIRLMNFFMKKDLNDNSIVIDHINNNRLDNRLCNLRVATKLGNAQNAKLRKDNTTKIKGINISRSNRPLVKIISRVQCDNERYKISAPLSKEGLYYSLKWIIFKRIKCHGDFSNFGMDLKGKTIEQAIVCMMEVFEGNLSEEDKKVYNNDGYKRKPEKFKPIKTLEEIKELTKDVDLGYVIKY